MTAAIFYLKDGFRINQNKIMGRQVAGNSFLKAVIKYTKESELYVYSINQAQAEDFTQFVRSEGIDKNIKFIDFENTPALSQPGLLFYPGPDISIQSKNRSFFKDSSWSICGITHTTSSAEVMEGIQSLVTSPIQPWDAVICTSKSVHSNVLKIIETEEENIRKRHKASYFIRPQLPIIPLGIHTSEFEFNPNDRENARELLGIKTNEIAILYVGRLSFHAKANPFPMYKALENVANISTQKIVLIECGFYGNQFIRNAFTEAFQHLAPNIRIIRVDGTNNEMRLKSFAAAHIFCSLSDNIQETFGITPIEAMASGLPVVVSDWDGYRESVRHNIDGFCVPTLMPPSGYGYDLSRRYALQINNYDEYIGYTSNFISVDIESTSEAFLKLISNKKLRDELGSNAKKRAIENFDWKKIILQYHDLWDHLKLLRAEAVDNNYNNYTWSAKLDPFDAFSSYPTQIISNKAIIKLKAKSASQAFEEFNHIKNLSIINYANYVIPNEDFVKELFILIEFEDKSINTLKVKFNHFNKIYLLRSLIWLSKYNLVSIK